MQYFKVSDGALFAIDRKCGIIMMFDGEKWGISDVKYGTMVLKESGMRFVSEKLAKQFTNGKLPSKSLLKKAREKLLEDKQ